MRVSSPFALHSQGLELELQFLAVTLPDFGLVTAGSGVCGAEHVWQAQRTIQGPVHDTVNKLILALNAGVLLS